MIVGPCGDRYEPNLEGVVVGFYTWGWFDTVSMEFVSLPMV